MPAHGRRTVQQQVGGLEVGLPQTAPLRPDGQTLQRGDGPRRVPVPVLGIDPLGVAAVQPVDLPDGPGETVLQEYVGVVALFAVGKVLTADVGPAHRLQLPDERDFHLVPFHLAARRALHPAPLLAFEEPTRCVMTAGRPASRLPVGPLCGRGGWDVRDHAKGQCFSCRWLQPTMNRRMRARMSRGVGVRVGRPDPPTRSARKAAVMTLVPRLRPPSRPV